MTLSIPRLAHAIDAMCKHSRMTLEETIDGRDVDLFIQRLTVSACKIADEMTLTGANIWRTEDAIVQEFFRPKGPLPVPAPDNAIPAHDPETGELTEPTPMVPEPPPAEPEPDVIPEDRDEPANLAADAPLIEQPGEPKFPEEDVREGPPDLGLAKVSKSLTQIRSILTSPAEKWAEMTGGVADDVAVEMLRRAHAERIDSAQHHYPQVYAEMQAVLKAGRRAP